MAFHFHTRFHCSSLLHLPCMLFLIIHTSRAAHFLKVILVAAAFIISCGGQVRSDVSDHRYKAGDLIPCYARGTGPFHNPSDIYGYYELPFCFVNEKKQTLRDILTGDQYLSSPYKLEFLVNEDSEVVCEKNLTREEVLKFQDAVAKDYYIQM
ncbi:hypothetical protein NC652_021519 [Populus alba x Populus x berolinensis]|nr:hypothetical protein NC652_021519 [Populus alba x Populus x berolinensis]